MNKQQKLKIVFPILFVVMAFVWGPIFMGTNPKNKADNNTRNIGVASGGNISNMDLIELSRGSKRKKAKTSHADWGRNPFIIGYDSKALIVEGIFWDEKNPKAILNGNIMGIGDQVGSSAIVTITQNSVIVKSESGVIELHLGEGVEF